ncbi:MAG: DUF4062 domain-containing protein [Dysgonamonadaceae bacterium]|nr:DUF4062 domain-containing protein [Dysgonamonadaceae bacterium]
METRKIYKCFISSPGDCETERMACNTVVEEINKGLAKRLGVNFETFMWEKDVLPDFGKEGQDIIDSYVEKSDYDIFIGIMKNRFGKPTAKAGSGTEHEFNEALSSKAKSKDLKPVILFFFGKENVDPIDFDFEQFQKVKEFKTKISDEGLYIDYSSLDQFKCLLKDKLEIFIVENSPIDKPTEKIKEVDIILKKLEYDLNNSLKIYNEKSPVWIEPIISSKRDVPLHPTNNDDNRVKIENILENPDNFIIKAPSGFGLSSLAHYIKLEAWKLGKTFLYVDSKNIKKNKVVRHIHEEAESYYFVKADALDCILLDTVCFEENGTMNMIKSVCESFENIPLIIFNTIDNNFFLKSDDDDKVEIKRNFVSLYLLPLPKNDVRKVVSSYSKLICEDNDVLLNKVTKDLETLNMHRTVKNCISILRACSKIGVEYCPVNRTKLLETILSTIFDEYEIPTYHDKKPDVKDCSFVLGYFCETLLLRNNFEFDDDFFILSLNDFCRINLIDLDVKYLLNVLIDNSILGRNNYNLIYFKNSYWFFYFVSQRMKMNENFLNYIYKNKSYIDYPEIIEFYTGIDRNRKDALEILSKDLDETLETVRKKVNIPDVINPYKSITWKPDIIALEKEEAKISEDVISSGLPDEVKDKYDDKNYNQIRPYNQVINSVIRDYSFLVLMRQVSAVSRALRNSDFVNVDLKKELLRQITQSWNEISKLLIILSPILADKGNVSFEGASFCLEEDSFKMEDKDQKRLAVLLSIPTNVIKFFKDDLFSTKMGPLLIDNAENEKNSLLKHEMMLLIIAERPKGWNAAIDRYIVSLDKNSFFLSDVLEILNFNKDYFATEISDRRIIDHLASKCRTKHILKSNNPDLGLINRLKKMESGAKF